MRLNRRKAAQKSNDSIRRKFSIDGILRNRMAITGTSTISKPYPAGPGNPTFTIRVEWSVATSAKARQNTVFGAPGQRLSVRLISL
jgi:hypothetical protein